jgi:hypothetical protein
MNSTFTNVSLTIHVDRGFLFFGIFSFICTIFVIVVATVFLLIIIFDKICHTVPMMLIGNSCLAELICGTVIFSMNVYSFQNDLNQLPYQDSLCVFRGYLSLSSWAIQNYSFLLQSIYRYTIVVYPNSLFWKSARTQILLIVSTWILAFAYPFPFIFTGEYIYDADNELCQIPLRLSFPIVFVVFIIYLIPINMIMLIYFNLVRYVKKISKNVASANMLLRAQRELKMVRRIVILVSFLVLLGLPYTVFILMSFFTTPPKYHFRIVLVFIDVSLVFIMICLFLFTDALKASIKKILKRRPNMVVPTFT